MATYWTERFPVVRAGRGFPEIFLVIIVSIKNNYTWLVTECWNKIFNIMISFSENKFVPYFLGSLHISNSSTHFRTKLLASSNIFEVVTLTTIAQRLFHHSWIFPPWNKLKVEKWSCPLFHKKLSLSMTNTILWTVNLKRLLLCVTLSQLSQGQLTERNWKTCKNSPVITKYNAYSVQNEMLKIIF